MHVYLNIKCLVIVWSRLHTLELKTVPALVYNNSVLMWEWDLDLVGMSGYVDWRNIVIIFFLNVAASSQWFIIVLDVRAITYSH